ncbi:unnamed protein product [Polarella glacialis]|nr:unnamed protein product [Polarella glacialis]
MMAFGLGRQFDRIEAVVAEIWNDLPPNGRMVKQFYGDISGPNSDCVFPFIPFRCAELLFDFGYYFLPRGNYWVTVYGVSLNFETFSWGTHLPVTGSPGFTWRREEGVLSQGSRDYAFDLHACPVTPATCSNKTSECSGNILTACVGSGTCIQNVTSFSGAGPHAYSCICTVSSNSGNQSSSCTGIVTLIDQTAPVVVVQDRTVRTREKSFRATLLAIKKCSGSLPVLPVHLSQGIASAVDACDGPLDVNKLGVITHIELIAQVQEGDLMHPDLVAAAKLDLIQRVAHRGCVKWGFNASTAQLPFYNLQATYIIHFTLADAAGNVVQDSFRVRISNCKMKWLQAQARLCATHESQCLVDAGCAACIGDRQFCGSCPNPGATIPGTHGVMCGLALKECTRLKARCEITSGKACLLHAARCTKTCSSVTGGNLYSRRQLHRFQKHQRHHAFFPRFWQVGFPE